MIYIKLLNSLDTSKTCDLCINILEVSGCYKLALPGILIITGHIVVCMVSGNNHQRTKDYFLISCFFQFLDHCLAGCIFRLTLYSSDKYIVISKLFHLCLHLRITYLCSMRCTMSHEYKCCSVFFHCIQTVKSCVFHCLCCDCFRYCCLVCIDNSRISSNFSEKWLCNLNRFKLIFISL